MTETQISTAQRFTIYDRRLSKIKTDIYHHGELQNAPPLSQLTCCHANSPLSFSFLSLAVYLLLYTPFIVLHQPNVCGLKSFLNFFFLFLEKLDYVHTNKVDPIPLISHLPFLTSLPVSHCLIRSRITHECGMVVPMPALCQPAWVCFCLPMEVW